MRRVDQGEININNYYVCEIHFPNQILDYATRKILIKTALPLTMAESKMHPYSTGMPNSSFNNSMLNKTNGKMQNGYLQDIDDDDDDDDFDDDNNDGQWF